MNDTQQKLDRAEQLIIKVLLNISKSTEILSNNLDEVNSINNSSNNNNNMNNNVNNINQLTLQIINNMNEVGTILKENKHVRVLFQLLLFFLSIFWFLDLFLSSCYIIVY